MKPSPNQIEDLDRRVQVLAEALLKKRDEAVEGRAASGVERRWREDQSAVDGLDAAGKKSPTMLDYATGESWLGQGSKEPARSRVVVNIIRGKCNTAEGRFSEVGLPVDDRNWGLKPTVVSDVVGGQGTALDEAQRQARQEDAKRKAAAMEQEIDDQLTESDFNNECRKVVRSAVRLGAGVLKGPSVVKSIKKAWVEHKDAVGSVYVMETMEKFVPSSKSCDIWGIYPDPNCGENPKKGAYIWENDSILPRELRGLIGVPGYSKRQILKVLAEDPKRTRVAVEKDGQKVAQTTVTRGAPYERWEYNGDVDREDLELMGCACPENEAKSFSACVVFVNDRPIKAVLNTLDTGELPYDFFQWEPIAGSPWGIGEPRKNMWQQRIITAAWRAMMDNAGDSAGSQIAMNDGVEPEDGIWDFSGKKIWIVPEGTDVRAAFAQHQIQNNQPELQNIIDLALKFSDIESGTPMLLQGEEPAKEETLGQSELRVQGADTDMRRRVKAWDDQITRSHIGGYYHWNMQYNNRNDIKGDFEVDPRGTSVLLVKHEAAQSLSQIFALRADPEVEILVDWEKAVKQLFEARHMDVLKSPEDVEKERERRKQLPPPVAPQVQAAQIREQGAIKRKEMDLTVETIESEKDRNLELILAEAAREIEAAKQSGDSEAKVNEIKARLADTVMKLNTQVALSPGKQVASPPNEPKGRAPDGQAFAK